jgi:hypothetical protein
VSRHLLDRVGTGRLTYVCRTCGRTARFGLPDGLSPEGATDTQPPRCPNGHGGMKLRLLRKKSKKRVRR